MKQNKYSNLKIFGFPDKVKSFVDGVITAPIYVRIKPTNRCNHGCRFCTYSDGTKRPKDVAEDHLKTGMHTDMDEQSVMPTSKAFELLDDLRDIGTKAVTFSGGGEPLLHKDIVEIMQRTLDNNLDLSIITNGQFITGERARLLTSAKWVRISVDYTSAAQMSASRHVPESSFASVINNIKSFSAVKRGCDFGVNYIVTRYNYTGLFDFSKMLKSIGIENIRFSPVYVENFQDYHAPIKDEVEAQLARIQFLCDDNFSVNTTYDIDSPSKQPTRPFSRCLYAQTVPVIGADLNCYFCHNQAYSKKGLVGSIKNQSFKSMWFSEEAKASLTDLNPSCQCTGIECANQDKVVLFNALADSHSDNFV